jgi:phosphatidate cytidylyltransferase
MLLDAQIGALALATLGVLVAGSGAGLVLRRRAATDAGRKTVDNLVARVNAWWVMVGLILGALALGRLGLIGLFGAISFLALRELLTLTPTRRADHLPLFYAFFGALPLQYLLVWSGWYGLFAIALPVYFFAFLSFRVAITAYTRGYLSRVATIWYGVMLGVYGLSHVPALTMLRIPGHEGLEHHLVVFLLAVVQLSDVAQYVWGKLLGRRPLAAALSPNKTVEGFVGGVATATLVGVALSPTTPFPPLVAGGLALAVALAGVAGGLVTSAIKRDAGIKDYGDLIPGHGGVMDRVDSLAFAAPLFFHLVRWAYSTR